MTPNAPSLWRSDFPIPAQDGHKYHRGHALIVGSDRYTGATRLASEACSRIGAGLVTVWNESQADLYRVTLPADLMVADHNLADLRGVSTVLAGPGGLSESQGEAVLSAYPSASYVLDADAIRFHTKVASNPCVVTPHEGEFERFFSPLEGNREGAAQSAAMRSNCVIVLKGARTLVCAPNGDVVTNATASPYLAKAGTGDVLAGLIAGLVTQGMPAFSAACAGVWLHGQASERIGPGLIPQDLMGEIRPLLRDLLA